MSRPGFGSGGAEPPHSREAEDAVIGAVLFHGAEVYDGCVLTPSDFWMPAPRAVWEAMHALRRNEKELDVITVSDCLKMRGEAAYEPYLVGCLKHVAPVEKLAWHVSLVARDSARRQLMLLANDIATRAREDENVAAVLSEMRDGLDKLIVGDTGGTVRVGDVLSGVIDGIIAKRDKPWERAVATGLGKFDRVIGGFRPGQLVVIAARPGIGKSSLLRGFCLHAAIRQKIPTLIFSLEVLKEELIEQFLAAQARVANERIDRGDLNKEEYEKIYAVDRPIREAPLFVNDKTLTIGQIYAEALRWFSEQNAPMAQIAVDYMGLVPPDADEGTREREVAKVSLALKKISVRTRSPVIALSQLNRKIEARGPDAEPMLSDLRESGAIEQDAHKVIFVHRTPPLDGSGPAKLIVGKNRGGRTGVFGLHWTAEYMTFTEALEPNEAAAAAEPERGGSWVDRHEDRNDRW